MDGGASSTATATPCGMRRRFPAEILLIGSREGCGPLELSRGRRGRIPLHTTLSQIPLKSCGFPGAESARKRFFLRGASSHFERISTRGDQPKSLISLGRSQSDLPFPTRRSPASIGSRGGSHPLELSRGLFWWRFWFPTKQAVLVWALVPMTRAWGAPLPYIPSGDGVREG